MEGYSPFEKSLFDRIDYYKNQLEDIKITRNAILYDINGLYKVINSDLEVKFKGNLQSCVFEKKKLDELNK